MKSKRTDVKCHDMWIALTYCCCHANVIDDMLPMPRSLHHLTSVVKQPLKRHRLPAARSTTTFDDNVIVLLLDIGLLRNIIEIAYTRN